MRICRTGCGGLLTGHDVRTTAYQGWHSITNGALLKAAEAAGFDAMITADQGVRYQQNRTGYRLALVVLSTNKETRIAGNIAAVLEALNAVTAGALVYVDLG